MQVGRRRHATCGSSRQRVPALAVSEFRRSVRDSNSMTIACSSRENSSIACRYAYIGCLKIPQNSTKFHKFPQLSDNSSQVLPTFANSVRWFSFCRCQTCCKTSFISEVKTQCRYRRTRATFCKPPFETLVNIWRHLGKSGITPMFV